MRPQIQVFYELELIGVDGAFIEKFSHIFDREIYNSDVEGTDVMMVNFKMQELKEKYSDALLLEFSVERGEVKH
ncbi:hypothetical protein CN984_12510 [Bacillus cereus]|uniref:Uncharacterized protein n=1 Tax=Bacillus cereus TaxID=1396 RepID=A0A2B9PR02_BACCE|nr:hypothetical protein [Bacillus cereus]PEA25918.1 hypothetical protein CON44_18445 [Bacillus cereus]PGO29240.1 hypothetical protein CN984_12510 [Bacillus cereus]